MPAYLVSLWDKLEVRADAEPDSCNWRPAELSFAFAGSSGNPMTETNFPVEFAGVYPAPASGSGHVTALDGTNQRPQVPVFIGRQDRMLLTECIEESVSKGDPELETLQCIKDYDLGRYSDDFSIGLSGIEDDPGGTPWYAYAGGLGAAALACTASYKLTGGWKEELGCAGGIATGYEIGKKIADWAGEDDDNLGTVDLTVNVSGGAGAGTQTRLLEGGDEGDLSVSFVTDRVGGLPILEYRVQIESVKLQEPYELNCFDAGNELILQARAVLVKDSATALNPSVPERFPEDGYEKVTPYEDGTFPEWVVNWTVAWESFEDPQWSPLLYLEFLLWEDDGDDHEADLIGIHSHSYSLSTLAAGSNDDAVSGGPFQGRAVRRIDFSDVVEVRGWDGSDCADCSGILATGCVCSGHRGRASVRYRIKFTWLKHALLE
jgi:hypothetical protein